MASTIDADPDRLDDESARQTIRESLLEYRRPGMLAMVMIWREVGKIAETGELSPKLRDRDLNRGYGTWTSRESGVYNFLPPSNGKLSCHLRAA